MYIQRLSFRCNHFRGRQSLREVALGDNVKAIDNEAFFWCQSLMRVRIGGGVKYIGNSAFANCNSLLSVEIPNAVQNIGENAFNNCEALQEVVIGDATDNNYLRLNSENKTLALCQASEVDNNSNVFFEEAGDVTELPSTDFTVISMRPGTIYSYALPVDITLPAEGVGAYTLSINNDNDDFVVTMQRINSQTVSAGTPFLLVADFDEDLLAACGGSHEAAYESDNNSNVNVKLSHGTEVTTQVDNDGVLQGTFKNVNLESYSAAVPQKNGFEIQRTARISPFTAYIQYEFTMEDMKYFNGPYIKPGLDFSTGISSVVEAVTQIGNIYTIDGRFVGKGNISSVNALPSGIYIVNGVKVSK